MSPAVAMPFISQPIRGIYSELWLEETWERPRLLCKRGRKCILTFHSFLLYPSISLFSIPVCCFWVICTTRKSIQEFQNSKFSSRYLCFPHLYVICSFLSSPSPCLFPFFCLFPSLHLLILQSQGEVKNIVSIQTSTCWKGNKSWTEVSGANIEEADIWVRDWSPSWRAKLKRG